MKTIFKKVLKTIFYIFFHIFWCFPIKKNRIFFESYNGNQYSCNPKYIFLALDRTKFDTVWFLRKTNGDCPQGSRIVRKKGFFYFFYLMTSKVAITNINFSSYIPFRKQQVLINTWHGGGAYKYSIFGYSTKDIEKSYSKFTYFVSSCSTFTEEVIRNTFHFKNRALEIGMPRNDLLFDTCLDKKDLFSNCSFFSADKLFVLFAPTYRDYKAKEGITAQLSFDQIGKALEARFGKKVVWVIRSHHFDSKDIVLGADCIDGRLFPDMQLLLKACDILITDYSSSIWDFSITLKPCFLFAPDLKKYESVRSFYKPINVWGFPYAENNSDLARIISTFNEDEYVENIKRMHKEWGSFETGNSSLTIAKIIEDIVYDQKR